MEITSREYIGETFRPAQETLENAFAKLNVASNFQVDNRISSNADMGNFAVSGGLVPVVGVRFRPTDEELVNHFLKLKILGHYDQLPSIAEVNVYNYDPWDLPGLSGMTSSGEEWYFFSSWHNKYGNGGRNSRRTEAGFWKLTGKDKKIKAGHLKKEIGNKRTLVYYSSNSRMERTRWIMHEYTAAFNLPNQVGLLQQHMEPIFPMSKAMKTNV
ncbi:hypothetical protein Tsubulata_028812 [Turnera subulata]|uniref:NAC domain-containing protein n=1 Tax=Turnera subulata TaxID=218843 RepID=A0A9Q0IYS1_9ROSI|nr:hypothetical protein Tsubulata_028812 [Turnera subulata]